MEGHAHNFKDITGMRFGRLTVLGYVEKTPRRMSIWRVRCDCGVEFNTYGYALRSGATRSCGCLRKEVASKMMTERHMKARKRKERRRKRDA